jgi:hypothetical protein
MGLFDRLCLIAPGHPVLRLRLKEGWGDDDLRPDVATQPYAQ